MLRPERMTFASIFCVKKDVESVLEALNTFGEFHIEEPPEGHIIITDYSKNIQKTEETFANVNQLRKQFSQKKTSLLDIFRIPEIAKTQVTTDNWQALLESTSQEILVLKKEIDELNNSLTILKEKTTQLNRLQNILAILQKMEADLALIEELKLIQFTVASVPRKNFEELKKALDGFPVILNGCYPVKDTYFICLASLSKYVDVTERVLKVNHADIFDIPKDLPHDISAALKEVNNKITENLQKENAVINALNNLGKKNKHKIPSWNEITENILAELRAKSKILESERLATLRGFVPEKKFQELKKSVHDTLGENILVLENVSAKVDDPPTKIKHSKFISPFEQITKLYGFPHYEEVDPTPVIAITFPLIFGLMFGDVGHGLILLAGGATVGKLIKKNQGIKDMGWILAACGVGAIIAGALYGEFFGTQVFHPLWFSPFSPISNVFTFLIFSLFVGIIQIMSGLALEMVNFLYNRKIIDALLTSVPKMAFYAGAVILVAVYQLNFAAWFSGPILLVIVPFMILVFAKPAFSALQNFSFRYIEVQNEKPSIGQRLFEGGDLVTRLLSNTISYTRILALLMAHWALILVTYTVAGLIGTASLLGLILSGFIIVGGNVFVLALEGLIVFIHTLRLHFYEWFSKFYQGNGTEFKAFRQNSVFTEVILGEKKV